MRGFEVSGVAREQEWKDIGHGYKAIGDRCQAGKWLV